MPNFRADRMSEDIQREIAAILREMKDPRLHNGIISVVRCETAHDLSYSKVYISSMNGLDTAKEAVKALKNAQGFIRHELGTRLRLRYSPVLAFEATDSIEYSANISRLLNDIHYTTSDENEENEE
ncbi:MAG: 30S ribosome-binding factor RbfA [Clostridia bacterium]|jgi:ribosome-binding factor A|nr:30S ribosome-binding factor RbfA [Clostridia bacterium]